MKNLLFLSFTLFAASLFMLSCQKDAPSVDNPQDTIPQDTIPNDTVRWVDNSIIFQLKGDSLKEHRLYCDGQVVKLQVIEFQDKRMDPVLCNSLAIDFEKPSFPAKIKLKVEYSGLTDTFNLSKGSCNSNNDVNEILIGGNRFILENLTPNRQSKTYNTDSIFAAHPNNPLAAINTLYSDTSKIMPPIPLKKMVFTFKSDTTLCSGFKE